MSGVNIFLTILSACGTICAIIFGYIAYKRNGKSDNKDEGKKDGVVLTGAWIHQKRSRRHQEKAGKAR